MGGITKGLNFFSSGTLRLPSQLLIHLHPRSQGEPHDWKNDTRLRPFAGTAANAQQQNQNNPTAPSNPAAHTRTQFRIWPNVGTPQQIRSVISNRRCEPRSNKPSAPQNQQPPNPAAPTNNRPAGMRKLLTSSRLSRELPILEAKQTSRAGRLAGGHWGNFRSLGSSPIHDPRTPDSARPLAGRARSPRSATSFTAAV